MTGEAEACLPNGTVEQIVSLLAASNAADDGRISLVEWLVATRSRFGTERSSAVASTLSQSGNYWCCCILLILQHGPLRPSMILKIMKLLQPAGTISQRMLTLDLREMERGGLVSRITHPSRRAHVEYFLTPEGQELSRRQLSLLEWIVGVAPRLMAARVAFDRQMEHETAAPSDVSRYA